MMEGRENEKKIILLTVFLRPFFGKILNSYNNFGKIRIKYCRNIEVKNEGCSEYFSKI